ncbi:MAG: DEAD/DEAH box helicase family protein [Phycisphaerales bacterium]|nr:DEAD/DEAH box helicase family protein [Phycisphaerales bacterium]
MNLRYYQSDAKAAIYAYLRDRDGNPCCVIPTGGGKTPLMASICHDAVVAWQSRVMIVSHSKELIEQTRDKLVQVDAQLPVGIYSAGLGARDTRYPVTVAGIQSVYKRGEEFGAKDLLIVDEAHMIPFDDDGMYRQLIATMLVVNPKLRIIGLTATAYRMKGGLICGPENVLNEICYEVGVRELIAGGFLSPLRTKRAAATASMEGVHVRGGEFVAAEVEERFGDVVTDAVAEIARLTKDRKSVLIFAAGVKHGQRVTDLLAKAQPRPVEFIDAATLHREAIIERFKSGATPYLVNVNVLTTGFDATNVDCVAILRATMSPGLWVQMVGRGSRVHPGKVDCLVLDFGGNAERHGPIDEVHKRQVAKSLGKGSGAAVMKKCPSCNELVAGGFEVCPDCGYVFGDRGGERDRHADTASDKEIVGGVPVRERYELDYSGNAPPVTYELWRKRGDENAPPTLRVSYWVNLKDRFSEWICFGHAPGSFPRRKAEEWWRDRSNDPCPASTEDAMQLVDSLSMPIAITVETKPGDKWPRVVGYELSKPDPEPGALFAGVGPCVACNSEDESWTRRLGRNGWEECCAWCGEFRRSLSPEEAATHVEDEVPF